METRDRGVELRALLAQTIEALKSAAVVASFVAAASAAGALMVQILERAAP